MTWVFVGAIILLGPIGASLAPILKRQPWWPGGNKKVGS